VERKEIVLVKKDQLGSPQTDKMILNSDQNQIPQCRSRFMTAMENKEHHSQKLVPLVEEECQHLQKKNWKIKL
jgi:hypothetical protein